jgi:hypothetical protein
VDLNVITEAEGGGGHQVAAVEHKEELLVCVGDEWHRYPSSFFLPSPSYRLAFIKSGFGGLLPRPFSFQEVDLCEHVRVGCGVGGGVVNPKHNWLWS